MTVPPNGQHWALAIHAGAGNHPRALLPEFEEDYRLGLRNAYLAGEEVLSAGGSGLDAVCASVCQLEDDPLFNAGRGATLDAAGQAEHDSSVMTGQGSAGAIAASRLIRHPVLAARAVMEQTPHVFIAAPTAELAHAWGLETEPPEWFVTRERRLQLAEIQEAESSAPSHGTVGAVALDICGQLAAATSTGGMANKAVGRIGDSPVIGAGTYAHAGTVAVSCTGMGEAFLEGGAAHEVHARVAYLGQSPAATAQWVLDEVIGTRASDGGMIIADANGGIVVAHNSAMMFSAWRDSEGTVKTLVNCLPGPQPAC